MAEPRVLFRGASVIDGTGNAPDVGDVRVVDGRIHAIGRLQHETGEAQYDLDGLALAPGFIDAHTHADCVAFLSPSDDD